MGATAVPRQAFDVQEPPSEPWLTARRAAEHTGYSVWTIYQESSRAQRGEAANPIPLHKINRQIRFLASELDAWMRSRARRSDSPQVAAGSGAVSMGG